MSSVFGTFTFNGTTFDAEYRESTQANIWSARGFPKCLIINRGKSAYGSTTDGHSYFGDDKWEVDSVVSYVDDIILTLKCSLRDLKDPNFFNGTNEITLNKKKKN